MKACVNCGRELRDEDNFCSNCGMAVKDMAFPETEEVEETNIIEEETVEETVVETETEEVAEESVEEVATEEVTEDVVEEPVEEEATEEVAEDVVEEPVAEEPETEDATEEPVEEPKTEAPEVEETTEDPVDEAVEESETEEATEEPAEEAETEAHTEESEESPFTIEDLEEDQEKNGTEVSEPTLALGLDYNYEQAEAAMAKMQNEANAPSKPLVSKKTLVRFGIVAAVIIVAIVAFNVISSMASTTRIDLADYITDPEYGGVDGKGMIVTEATIDDEKVEEFMSDVSNMDDRFAIKSFFNGITLEADKTEGLSEGDTITISARYSESNAEAAGIKVKNSTKTVTVDKLDVLDSNVIGVWVMSGAERNGYVVSVRRLGRDYRTEPTFEMKEDGTAVLQIKDQLYNGTIIVKDKDSYEFQISKEQTYSFYIQDEVLRMDYVEPQETTETDESSSYNYNTYDDEPETMVLLFEK